MNISPLVVLTCIIPALVAASAPKSNGLPLGSAPEPLTDTTYCFVSIDVAFHAVPSASDIHQRAAESS